MSSQSILLIGAGGYIGHAVAKEFLAQKSKFARVAILVDPSKADKFAEDAKSGMEIVVGSFLESASFSGPFPLLPLPSTAYKVDRLTTVRIHNGHLNARKPGHGASTSHHHRRN